MSIFPSQTVMASWCSLDHHHRVTPTNGQVRRKPLGLKGFLSRPGGQERNFTPLTGMEVSTNIPSDGVRPPLRTPSLDQVGFSLDHPGQMPNPLGDKGYSLSRPSSRVRRWRPFGSMEWGWWKESPRPCPAGFWQSPRKSANIARKPAVPPDKIREMSESGGKSRYFFPPLDIG